MGRSLEEAAAKAELYPEIRALFERAYGRIQEDFWCTELLAGVAFTLKDTERGTGAAFHAITNWTQEDAPFVEQTIALDELELATRFLPDGRTRTRSVKLIFDAYSSALDAMDSRRAYGLSQQDEELRLVKDQVELARRFFRAAGERYAQSEYIRGMVIGYLPVVAVAGILGTFLWAIGAANDGLATRLVAWSLAGATGAPLSVLIRVAKDKFTLNWEASREELWTAGAIRPLIGAVLGAAIPMVIVGGLAGSTTALSDSDDLRSHSLYLAVALAAGFSERWAPDLLAKQSSVLGSTPADEDAPDSRGS